MTEWYSEKNLERAWKYAWIDIRDDFVFDVINYEDIKSDKKRVLETIHSQIKDNQYYPAPILRIGVPKNEHSVRPGTTIPIIDLIILYAIAQQLAPLLDPLISDSAYAYRLNPKADKSRQPLFKNKTEPDPEAGIETEGGATQAEGENKKDQGQEDEDEDDIGFPYDWFINWIQFQTQSVNASEDHEFAAITDITAYFENISFNLLREILKEKLEAEQSELVDRLFRVLEFWDWTPSGNLPRGIGLPQGNSISSFLSNLYLIDLDNAMLDIVSGDGSKYFRYVDDIKLFTNERDEARQALVAMERILRTLNLNIQSAKTKIVPANSVYDPEIEAWLEKMNTREPKKVENAIEFFDSVFEIDNVDDLQRPYLRCLSVLAEAEDDRAVDTALKLFLDNPAHKLLIKNFLYLRRFVTTRSYGETIAGRLTGDTFIFPYHRAYLYRLAAYSRDEVAEVKNSALRVAADTASNWFCRMAALFCLHTFHLTGDELTQIFKVVNSEANPQVARSGYTALCQHAGKELRTVLDHLTFFNAPYQEYFRRYFFRLYKSDDMWKSYLPKVKNASLRAHTFIQVLHQLDLLKAGDDSDKRSSFNDVIERKISECEDDEWPRLKERLTQIKQSFIVR